jgi:hypothetical protein
MEMNNSQEENNDLIILAEMIARRERDLLVIKEKGRCTEMRLCALEDFRKDLEEIFPSNITWERIHRYDGDFNLARIVMEAEKTKSELAALKKRMNKRIRSR